MRNKWRISHLEYLHVDLRRLAFRTLFEAVTDAFTKESEQQVDSTMALTICENKVTFSERSYAHCSMSIYMHPRLRRYGVELDLRHVARSLPWCMLPEKWHDWSGCFALWEGIERSTRRWVNRRSLAALLNR